MDTPPSAQSQRPAAPGEAGHPPHQEWYRFVLLLTGSPTLAGPLFHEVITAALEQTAHFKNKESRRIWLVRRIREKTAAFGRREGDGATGSTEGPTDGPTQEEALARVKRLPEPARSVFALFHVIGGEIADLANLVGLKSQAFSEKLAEARRLLDPSAQFPADPWVQLHRPWGKDAARTAKAVRAADPESLRNQTAFDRRWHEQIERIQLPSNLYLPEFATPSRPGLGVLIRQPAVLAIVCALLVVVGVVVLVTMQQMDDFPGREQVSELVEDSVGGNGVELEAFETPMQTGDLADWFLLKGFDDFNVPSELETAVAIGARVYEFKRQPIAQIALKNREALLFVFRSDSTRESLNPLSWYPFQHNDWAVAVRNIGNVYYAIAYLGDSDEMADFLREITLNQPPAAGAAEGAGAPEATPESVPATPQAPALPAPAPEGEAPAVPGNP